MEPSILEVVAPVHLPKLAAVMFLINGLMVGVKRDKRVPDWVIPFLCVFLGALLYPFWVGWSGETAIFGAIAGLLAVGGNQMLRQGKEALGLRKEVDGAAKVDGGSGVVEGEKPKTPPPKPEDS
jgi:hypothetical protein